MFASMSSAYLLLGTLLSVVTSSSAFTAHYSLVEGIKEHVVIGDVIRDSGLGDATDSNVIRSFRFAIVNGEREQFLVDRSKGLIRTNMSLDRDVVCPKQPECRVTLDVAVVQPIEYFQVIQVTIDILDLNDNTPVFPQRIYHLRVSENTNPGVKFVIPAAYDPDSVINGIQSYRLDSNSSTFALKVNAERAGLVDLELVLTEHLDRERVFKYRMYVVATDGGRPGKSGSMMVDIEVMDANDNPPVFDHETYDVTVSEGVSLDHTIATVHAEDVDEGVNGLVTYSLVDHPSCLIGPSELPDQQCQFAINTETGDIILKQRLDYEVVDNHLLLVQATDQGPNAVPAYTKVNLHVLDVNDMAPVISVNGLIVDSDNDPGGGNSDNGQVRSSGYVEVEENQPPGTFAAYVSVDDLDGGPSGLVKCMINHELTFTMTRMYENQYKIVTNLLLDREMTSQYDVRILCQDDGEPVLSSTFHLLVMVKDQNDNSPVFTRSVYKTDLIENNLLNATLLRVRARDPDVGPNADITYHVHSAYRSLFSIGERTGMLRPKVRFDRESADRVDAQILAVDHGTPRKTGTAIVRVTIVDANDCTPEFAELSYTFGTYEGQQHGTVIGTVHASDQDTKPYAKFTYTLQNYDVSASRPFIMDRYTGEITTTRVLDREVRSTYYLLGTATDAGDPELYSTVNITIYVADKNDNAPVISFPGPAGDRVVLYTMPETAKAITKIVASDADMGENARIQYSIIHGNDWGLWHIEADSGFILFMGGGSPLPTVEHLLVVVAKDSGEPALSTTAKLTIIFNLTRDDSGLNSRMPGDSSFRSHESSDVAGGIGPELQFRIILVLAVVTTIIVLVLVTIIVILRRRQMNEKKRKRALAAPNSTEDQTYIFVNNNQDGVASSGFIKGVCEQDDPPDPLLQILPGVDRTSILDLDLSSSGISMGSEGCPEVSVYVYIYIHFCCHCLNL